MVIRVLTLAAVLLFCLGGCAATTELASIEYQPPSGKYRVVVMRPDISVGVLTAGGMSEPRQDWTLAARDNVLASLREQQAKRGGSTQIVFASTSTADDDPVVAELDRLHAVVGQSVLLHKYTSRQKLPTKEGKFDWTLGKLATDYGAATGYDYALFLYARDNFSSGARVALRTVSMLACVVGMCVLPSGGKQEAFVSLVDLKTGNVVWFNHVESGEGDIRTPEGADAMVGKLLATMGVAKTPEKS